jgi:DNA-binding MarR family transcriptional regulator
VHATVKHLIADGLVELEPNADHRRSQLVRMTEQGERRYAAIDRLQIEWVNRLARRIGRSDLETTRRVLDELCARLGNEVETDRTRNDTKEWTDATPRTR